MALRLLAVGAVGLALGVYGAALAVYLVVIAYGCGTAGRMASPRWQRLRLFFPFVLMNVLYQATRPAVLALGLEPRDGWLIAADRRLMGGDVGLLLDRSFGWLYTPLLSEIFSFCYSLFFIYLALSVVRAARRPLNEQAAFSVGLWSVYAVGLLGYTLVPARGPFVAFADLYGHPITGWFFTHLNHTIVANGSSVFDVFPSLHTAATVYLLWWDRRTAPRWFRIWLVPVVLIWLGILYLRYHYVVDMLAGACLAAICLFVAFRYLKASQRSIP
jgi:membrane-associated phospholipid phosphatase